MSDISEIISYNSVAIKNKITQILFIVCKDGHENKNSVLYLYSVTFNHS